MVILLRIILSVLLLTVFTIKTVNAAVLDFKTIANKVKKDVKLQINSKIKGNIITEIKAVPFKKLNIPNGKVEINTSINLKFFNPTTIANVSIIVNGKSVRTFILPVKVKIFDKVWVARYNINNGESFNINNITLENKEIGFISNNVLREDFSLLNSKTKRNYKVGDVIDKRYIAINPCIEKNSIVSILFENSDFTIVLMGEAMQEGKIGDFIKVRNKQYKKLYTGKILSAGKVLVNI